MNDTKEDQETDLAETPEQGNQSSGAFPPPIADIKVLFLRHSRNLSCQ